MARNSDRSKLANFQNETRDERVRYPRRLLAARRISTVVKTGTNGRNCKLLLVDPRRGEEEYCHLGNRTFSGNLLA